MNNTEMILNDANEVKFGKHTFTAEAMTDMLANRGWVSIA